MSIFEKWFGKWEVVSKREAVVEVNSLFNSGEVECFVIIEKNSKTGEERAYVKFINGVTKEIDVDFARVSK